MCFAASRNLAPNNWVYQGSRRLMEFCRGVPEVIFAILFVWAVGVGPLAGLLAIAIHSAGALGKLRSEEHTSELQSLMRISYAVFCLKKKTQKMPTTHTQPK